MGNKLFTGLKEVAEQTGRNVEVNYIGSMGCAFFTSNRVRTYKDVMTCNTELFAQFHRCMLERGIYSAPSQFETLFISTAHSEEDIERIIVAAKKSFTEIQVTN